MEWRQTRVPCSLTHTSSTITELIIPRPDQCELQQRSESLHRTGRGGTQGGPEEEQNQQVSSKDQDLLGSTLSGGLICIQNWVKTNTVCSEARLNGFSFCGAEEADLSQTLCFTETL